MIKGIQVVSITGAIVPGIEPGEAGRLAAAVVNG